MGRNLPVISPLKIMTEYHPLFWGLAGCNLPVMLVYLILKEALLLARGQAGCNLSVMLVCPIPKEALLLVREQAVRNLLVIALLEGALLFHDPPVAQLLNSLPFRTSVTAPPPIQELDFNLAVGYPIFRFVAALRQHMVPVGVR